jgi:hypothetical protein
MKQNLLNEEIRRIKNMMGLQEQTNPAFKKFSNLTFKLDALPAGIANYNPSIGYIRIDGGNEWLASNRAISLKNYLLSQFKGSIEEQNVRVNETKVLGAGDANQYVIGTFYGKMKKEPEKQEMYPYTILYNFYEIGGVPHILVTQLGKGSPEKLDSTKGSTTWVNRFNKYLEKIPAEYNAKIVNQTVGGGSAEGPNRAETIYGIMIPITQEKFGYTAREKSRVHFDANNVDKFKEMANFIADYTADDFRTDESLKNPNARQHNFTSSTGGAGNYIFGDLGTGRKGKILSVNNPNGTDIVIKRMEPSVEGVVPGAVKSGSTEEWFDLGSYKLDDNFFKDNMISIKPETYKQLFDGINNLMKAKKIEDFRLVELGANISGYASSDNATNRLPEGTKVPDHTYGNRVPADKWVQRD